MPLYLIERRYAEELDLSDEEARLIEEVNADEGVSWLVSFLSADRRTSYCLYEAGSPDALRVAAARAGLPADVITEVRPVDPPGAAAGPPPPGWGRAGPTGGGAA